MALQGVSLARLVFGGLVYTAIIMPAPPSVGSALPLTPMQLILLRKLIAEEDRERDAVPENLNRWLNR